jgi:large subunit ribosomal protein L6e
MPAAAKTAAKKAAVKKVQKVKRTADNYSTVRKSLSVGTVAIMLAGRFRGKRVVVLKQLAKNGALVVSGPYKYNGVPLRRVNPAYVIATSTKVDLSGVDTSKVTAETFKRAAATKTPKGEKAFFDKKKSAKKADKKKLPDTRVALQKSIDAGVISAIKKHANGKMLPGYLRSVFTLKAGDMPHRMQF